MNWNFYHQAEPVSEGVLRITSIFWVCVNPNTGMHNMGNVEGPFTPELLLAARWHEATSITQCTPEDISAAVWAQVDKAAIEAALGGA
jgi:hypothetical protein